MLSEAANSGLQRIADIAPTLKEGELRVLLHLAKLTEFRPHHSVRVSKRDIASATKLARSAIERAVPALISRGLLTWRKGTATEPSAFIVNLFSTVVLGSPVKGPPATDEWNSNRATGALFQDTGSPFGGPPAVENTPLSAADSHVDIEGLGFISKNVIDRVLKARGKKETPDRLALARRWMHGYASKFPAPQFPNPHAPDDDVLAQFLAVAPWPQLLNLFYDLMAERTQAGDSYAWFVTVALQRIHGIAPGVLKERRQQLKLVRREKQLAGEVADPQAAADIFHEVASSARGLK